MTPVRFRHNAAVAIAGLIAVFGTIPVATTRWFLAPLLLIPLAVAVWGWRAGTDVDPSGVSVRALLGQRHLGWEQISGFVPADRRVHATLAGGGAVLLPAVAPADLPRLLAASGHPLPGSGEVRQPPEKDRDEATEGGHASVISGDDQ